jgi:two-component system chemotaxis response regulator CheY
MPRILIVDDAQFMRLRCARLLGESGYEIIEAQNGREAVEQYLAHKPDAVLMDITMPEMDGLAALKQIRQLDPGARITMLTALGQQGIVMEAIKAGARDFVVKPFEADRVLSAVKRMIG